MAPLHRRAAAPAGLACDARRRRPRRCALVDHERGSIEEAPTASREGALGRTVSGARGRNEGPLVIQHKRLLVESTQSHDKKRRRPDSNRCTRLCRPLPNHSATSPDGRILAAPRRDDPRGCVLDTIMCRSGTIVGCDTVSEILGDKGGAVIEIDGGRDRVRRRQGDGRGERRRAARHRRRRDRGHLHRARLPAPDRRRGPPLPGHARARGDVGAGDLRHARDRRRRDAWP